MHADNRRIDHLHCCIMRGGQRAHNPAPDGIINPPRPVMTDATALILLPLSGVQPTWRNMLLAASRSKLTQSGPHVAIETSTSVLASSRTPGQTFMSPVPCRPS